MSLKYNVGDKVRIKSLDWYNENKDIHGFIKFGCTNFIPEMTKYCDEVLTISQVEEDFGSYLTLECPYSWTDEMIEELVEKKESNASNATPDYWEQLYHQYCGNAIQNLILNYRTHSKDKIIPQKSSDILKENIKEIALISRAMVEFLKENRLC